MITTVVALVVLTVWLVAAGVVALVVGPVLKRRASAFAVPRQDPVGGDLGRADDAGV